MLTPDTTPATLRTTLEAKLPPEARTWLDEALRAAASAGGVSAGAEPGGAASAGAELPGFASSGSGQSRSGQSGSGQSGSGQSDPAQSGSATSGSARSGSGQSGSGQSDPAQPGPARSGSGESGPAPTTTTHPAHLPPGSPPTPTSSSTLPAWERHFAAARRRCGRDAADGARVLILHAARVDAAAAVRLYERGDAAERRAVLTALPHLDLGPGALGLVEDALRTNDTRLIAAALGPYAAEHLDPHGWRQAVLKCLFTGVPVDGVAGLADRARGDAELARMVTDYAAERTAAGRPVPADLHRVLDLAGPHHPRGDRGEES